MIIEPIRQFDKQMRKNKPGHVAIFLLDHFDQQKIRIT